MNDLSYLSVHNLLCLASSVNCTPLLADLFLHSYEAEFVQELLREGEKKLAQSLNYTFRYTDDVLSQNNKNFINFFTPNISSGTRSQRYY